MCVFFFFFQFVERCAHKGLRDCLSPIVRTHCSGRGYRLEWKNGRANFCGLWLCPPPPTLAGHRPSAAPLPLRDRASTILKPEFCGPSVIVPRNDCIDRFAI